MGRTWGLNRINEITIKRVTNKNIVKLAPAYATLALSLLTFTALQVRTLCTRTHEPGSGDVKL